MNAPRGRYGLPPLTSLLVFESAARLRGFKAAADELEVTPGAVSHQIKALESELGISLFRRVHRGVELTSEAMLLFESLESGFTRVAEVLGRIRAEQDRGQVTIASTTAVSSLWLTPRLTRFWKEFPDIAVDQQVSDLPDDGFVPIGLRIVYGKPPVDDDRQTVELFRDDLVPVCSPAYAARQKEVSLESLASLPLMHVATRSSAWTRWRDWFDALGHYGEISNGRYLNNYTIALQCARDDAGVVLGWRRLVAPLLERGVLVVLGPYSISAPDAFHLVFDTDVDSQSATARLRDWLIASASGDGKDEGRSNDERLDDERLDDERSASRTRSR